MDIAQTTRVSSAEAVLRSLKARVAVLDHEGAILDVNEAWRAFACGHAAEATSCAGANYLDVCDRAAQEGDEIARAAASGIREVLRQETSEYTLEYPCGELWFLMSVTPLPDQAPGAVVMHHDITKRKSAELALQESEQRLRRTNKALRRSEQRLQLALTGADAGVWETEIGACEPYWSPELRRLFGFADDEPASLSKFAERVHPDDLGHVLQSYAELESGRLGELKQEYRIIHPQRGIRWVLDLIRAHREDGGQVKRLIGVDLDITDRKLAQEMEMMAAKEAEHRSRNLLAVVMAVLKLTRADTKDEYIATVRNRICALARAHSLLSASDWTGADLSEIVAKELEAFATAGTERLTATGPPARISPKAVQPLAMMLYELATNAAKHGALTSPSGRIAISWSIASDGRLRIAWTEEGGPAVQQPERQGFGSEMITRAALEQLQAEVNQDWQPTGLRLVITLGQGSFTVPAEAASANRTSATSEEQGAQP